FNENQIHRYEIALALTESRLSIANPEQHKDCRFVGKRSIAHYREASQASGSDIDVPRDPRRVYKGPVWRAYRAAMEHLGLLVDLNRLAGCGSEAARAYQRAVRYRGRKVSELSDRACLSDVSIQEKGILRDLLGFSLRGSVEWDKRRPASQRCLFA